MKIKFKDLRKNCNKCDSSSGMCYHDKNDEKCNKDNCPLNQTAKEKQIKIKIQKQENTKILINDFKNDKGVGSWYELLYNIFVQTMCDRSGIGDTKAKEVAKMTLDKFVNKI